MTEELFKNQVDNNTIAMKHMATSSVEALKGYLRDVVAPKIKESLPELKTLSWVQYNPSFEDGDPCELKVYPHKLTTRDDVSYNDYETVLWNNLEPALRLLPEEALTLVYGVGVEVTMDIDTGNITTKEYWREY